MGVHNFVLGAAERVRYSRVVASTAAAPAQKSLSRWKTPPTLRELALLVAVAATLFVLTVTQFRSYSALVDDFGDNEAYISTAAAIDHWRLSSIQTKQFWGYPYAMALLSAITGAHEKTSLLLVSISCSAAAAALSFRLWGGWIAVFFALINFEWLQRSFLGGAEPLFMLLLLAAFWSARKERWPLACVLAACATVTRPVGFFALLTIGGTLLIKKRFKTTVLCTLIAVGIGALYAAPFWIYFGDPLYQEHRYQTADWQSGSPVTWPGSAIAGSLIHNQQPWTNIALTVGWVLFVLIGGIALARKSLRSECANLAESGFALLYIGFLFCYNSPQWARADFVRFAVPALPFVLFGISKWIPRDRRLLWGLAVVSPVLSAASALGVRNVIHALRA